MFQKIKNFLKECARVLRVTKKPNANEFKTIIKVTAIGILLIGLIGYIIQIGWALIKRML